MKCVFFHLTADTIDLHVMTALG